MVDNLCREDDLQLLDTCGLRKLYVVAVQMPRVEMKTLKPKQVIHVAAGCPLAEESI